MHFTLVDRVLERTGEGLVAIKAVSAAEEYLQDHFPTFPVLPGVFMLESMVQAAREWTGRASDGKPMVLGRVRALRYGTFVRPGDVMRIEVVLRKREDDGSVEFDGQVKVIDPQRADAEGTVAASGRILLRPARVT